jgi:hypothetical protein
MAAIMTLFNRAVSFFKKEEVSTDEEQVCESPLNIFIDREMSDEDEQLCEPIPPNIRVACNKEIPDMYYKREHRMCRCCHEISLGGEKQCSTCGIMKDIKLFSRPYLFRCRKSVNAMQELE